MKQTATILLFVCLLSVTAVHAKSCIDDEYSQNFVDFLTCLNYPVETHYVTTQDGYILTVYRTQAKNTTITSGKAVILMQHGLLDSSDGWVLNEEHLAPGLILANLGHDLWFGNSRGNKYSLNHTSYNPSNEPKFWEFSWMHMSDFDLPAVFSYIAEKTGQKINYIGHSQGTTQMFAHLANPDGKNKAITDNLRKFAALGPPTYMGHVGSKLLVGLDRIPLLLDALDLIGKYGIFQPNWMESEAASIICKVIPYACAISIELIADLDTTVDNLDRLQVLLGHYPGGTSVNNIRHWAQEVSADGSFQKYDFGVKKNMIMYGQPMPPKYNASLITEDLALFVGNGDELADKTDATQFYNEMTNAKHKEIHYYEIGHLTFLIGKTLPFMDDLIKYLDIPQGNQQQKHLRGSTA